VNNLLRRLLRVQPDETVVTLSFCLILFSNAVAQQITGVVGYSGFVSTGGPYAILLLWIVVNIAITAVALLQVIYIDRINRVRTLQILAVSFGAFFLIVRLMFALQVPTWIPYGLLTLVADQQYLIFPAIMWILAGDLFSMAQGKRIFPVIGGIGFLGRLCGLAIAAAAPSVFKALNLASEDVLVLVVLLYVAMFVIIRIQFRDYKQINKASKTQNIKEIFQEARDFILEVPLFRYLMLAVGAMIACSVVTEFYYTVFAKNTFADKETFQTFFSAFKLGMTLLSFGVQTFLTSRLLKAMRVENLFFFLPLSVLGGLILAFAFPGLFTSMLLYFAFKLPRQTVDDSAHRSVRSLIPDERRGRISVMMDTMIVGAAAVLGCVITGIIVLIGYPLLGDNVFYLYLAEGLIFTLIALWATQMAKSKYTESLLSWQLSRKKKSRPDAILKKLDF